MEALALSSPTPAAVTGLPGWSEPIRGSGRRGPRPGDQGNGEKHQARQERNFSGSPEPRKQEPAEMKGRIKGRRKLAARRKAFQKFATSELYQRMAVERVSKKMGVLCITLGKAVHWDDGQLYAEDHAEAEAIISKRM